MFFYSTKTNKRIFHTENCKYVRAIKEENSGTVVSATQARNDGFRICKCCSRIEKDYKKNENEILKFMYENAIRCNMNKGAMLVETWHEKWMILDSDKNSQYELHHKNQYKKGINDSVHGYHNQHVWGSDIMQMFKYIAEHEWYRTVNPLHIKHEKKPPKKGTKRWLAQQRKQKKKEKNKQIKNVYKLFDSLAI